MAIKLAILTTTLEASADFSTWVGYPLLISEELSSEFTYDVVRGLSTTLIESSSFTSSVNPKRELSTTLVETSVFSASILRLDYVNTPIPVLEIPPSQVPEPSLPNNFTDAGKRTPLTFSIFYLGNLYLSLNAPEFGDSETLQKIHVKEYSRGNTLISFRIAAWGEEKIFEYSFTWMSKLEKDILLNIMRNLLGYRIQILDHLGITRTGFIISPDAEILESDKNGFSTTLRFQQVD